MPVHPDAEDDVTLLRASAAGNRSAFERVMDLHEAAVHRFIRTLTGDRSAAEDVLQETFLAAWRGAGAFRAEASVRSWLFTIARHAVYRQFRRHAGEPAEADTTPLDELGVAAGWGAAPDPEAEAMRGEERARVARVLDSLDAEDRRVLVLREIEQLSGEEAAAVLGLSVPALKSRLHRARLRLAARLRQEGTHGI